MSTAVLQGLTDKIRRLEKQLKRKDLSEALSDSPWHRFLSWHFDQ
jgi:hypothetical protein